MKSKITVNHDVLLVLDYFRAKHPALIVPGATTTIGNIYVEYKYQNIKRKD